MSAHKVLITFLVVVVPFVTYLWLPGFEERLAMRMREGRHREVAVELERLVASGDERTTILATLGRAYEAEVSGKLGRAIEIMETYVSRRPLDPEGFRALAGLYVVANRPHAMVTAEALRVGVAPTRVDVSRLLGLYRLYGRFDEERELLWSIRNAPTLERADLLRLADILATKGDKEAAIEVLAGVADRLDPNEQHSRLLLFELLVSSGRTAEAVERAKHWLTNWRMPWLAARCVRRLAQGSPVQDLDALVATAVGLHPEIKSYLAQILVDSGQRASANRLMSLDGLRRRIDTSSAPTTDDVSAFLDAVRVSGNPALIWQTFAGVLEKPSAGIAQVYLAEALVHQFGYAAISSVRSRLSFDALSRNPLFAVRLALQENNQLLAQRLLQDLDVHNLSPDDQSTWFGLMTRTFSDEVAFRVLTCLRIRGALPIGLLPSYVALARRLGHIQEQMLAIVQLNRS